jgi:hypothetical protein
MRGIGQEEEKGGVYDGKKRKGRSIWREEEKKEEYMTGRREKGGVYDGKKRKRKGIWREEEKKKGYMTGRNNEKEKK